MKQLFLFTLALLLNLSVGYSADDKKAGVEALDSELRALLQQEMRAIEAAMKDMVSFNAAGDFQKIEAVAGQIENSFILKQNLTQGQMHQLHTLLPEDFLNKDTQFHYDAGMLQHAAANKKPELIAFYYSKLIESCGSCHQVHAKHKFPQFNQNKTTAEHDH